MNDDVLAQATAGIQALIPIAGKMNIEVLQFDRGAVACTVPFEGNGNHFGAMYAGALFTVAELLGGAISMTSFDQSRFYPLVKDLKIDFKRPATTAVTARTTLSEEQIAAIVATAEEVGKAEYVLEAELTDAEGTVVATTAGTYQIRANPS